MLAVGSVAAHVTEQVLRGQVWFATLHWMDEGERKPFVIVSNNDRNRRLGTFLGARITTTQKHPLYDSMIRLLPGEPIVGTVLCDDIELIYPDELRRPAGALTAVTMARAGS